MEKPPLSFKPFERSSQKAHGERSHCHHVSTSKEPKGDYTFWSGTEAMEKPPLSFKPFERSSQKAHGERSHCNQI
jgi:hypothetical protein